MAKLRNIHIRNFKIHKDTKIFANRKRIGNLMVLAGKNDMGKTSVLQALDVFFNDFNVRKNDFFQPNHDIIIECKIDDTLLKKTFNATNIVNERIDTTIKLPKFLLFDTSNHIALTEIKDYSIDDIIYVVENQIARFVQYNLDSNKEFIYDCFWEIDIHSFAKESKVTNLLIQWKKLLEDFNTINKTISIENRGAGVQRICALYYYLMQSIMKSNCQDYIFAIDEPELSLHPEQQRKFIQILQSVSKAFDNIQIIITTHSPYIINEVNTKDIFVLKHKTKKDKGGNIIELPEIEPHPLDASVLKNYTSLAEINYLAFGEPSIEYHQELYCYMQSKLNLTVRPLNRWLDNWLNSIGDFQRYDWYDVDELEKTLPTGLRSGAPNTNKLPEQATLPYCVRNCIDHSIKGKCYPLYPNAISTNSAYSSIDNILKSIDIMREAIKCNPNSFV